MLAESVGDYEELSYPLFASAKFDGVRCCIIEGTAYSRNLKPIPNKAISQMLSGLPALDGELVVGPPTGKGVMTRTTSGVMSVEGVPEFTLYVFDVLLRQSMAFNERTKLAKSWAASCGNYVRYIPQTLIKSAAQLRVFHNAMVEEGYEGTVLRSPDSYYKHGRSTLREQGFLRVVPKARAEATIIGFEEREHNANEQTRDELGRAKRSSHKAGKVGTGTLGAICVKDAGSGVEFKIGTGWSAELGADIWGRRDDLVGRLVTYEAKDTVKDKPRQPVFIGFRDAADL